MKSQTFTALASQRRADPGAAFTTPSVTEKRLGVDDDLGFEFDRHATYKIYDNLTYTIAAGLSLDRRLLQGCQPAAASGNDYMLLNSLMLAF